jgi:hypothetical protein
MAPALCNNGSVDPTGVCAGSFGGVKVSARDVDKADRPTNPIVTGDTGNIPWNADSSRVLFGREPGRPALGSGAGTVPTSISVYDITRRDSKGWLTNLKANDPDGYGNMIALLRSGGFLGARANSDDSIRRAVDSVAKEAAARYKSGQTEDVDFLDYLYSRVGTGGTSGSSGSRAYTGPSTTTTLMNERDLRSTADAVASTVIGRGITDEEFQKVLKRVRSAERAEPSVSIPGVGSNVSMPGLSAEGRQDIIRDALMKGPEAEDYGKATKMMDLFYKTLEARPEGA